MVRRALPLVIVVCLVVGLHAQTGIPFYRMETLSSSYHVATCSLARRFPIAPIKTTKGLTPCTVCKPNRDPKVVLAELEAARQTAFAPTPIEAPAVPAPSGLRLTVVTKAGDVVEGRWRSATETHVVLEVAGQRLDIPVTDVRYLSFVGVLTAQPATSAPVAVPVTPASVTPTPAAALPAVPRTAKPVLPATRTQCAATTQRGTRCARMADLGSAYCWQHK